MKLLVVAGPNGSGKSTIVEGYIDQFGMKYICPDNYTMFFGHLESMEDRYKEAMDAAEADRWTAIENGDSFAFETVFSTEGKLEFIKDAKNLGYEVEVLFITTSDPEINLRRVRQRVSEGGHDVPKEKLIQRYHRSMGFLPAIIRIADQATVYDNTEDEGEPVQLFRKRSNEYIFFNKGHRPEWCEALKSELSADSSFIMYDLTPEETKEYFS